MLRFKADLIPVTLILSLTALDFVLYFTLDNIWLLSAYFVLTIIPKGCICSWNHHHQHTRTFKSTVLNRIMELSYALHTGVTTNLWLLHHVLGHHHNYLDQTKDESRWMRKDGTIMGMLEYTLNVAATSYYRGFKVGKRFPKLLRTHLIYTALAFSLAAALTAYHPMQGIMLFILPMITGLLITAWATYDHHTGLVTEDHFEASYNNMNPMFNLVTGNLGYHTAHHYKQGVHWSQLPALHEKIKHRIPAHLYNSSKWDALPKFNILRIFGLG